MNYKVVVWNSKKKVNKQEAAAIYENLLQGNQNQLEPTEDIDAFLKDIGKKHMLFERVPEDQMEQCPWETPFDVSECHVILPLKREWGQLVKFILKIATKHNLTYYDPQSQMLYHPIWLFSWLKKMRRHVMP